MFYKIMSAMEKQRHNGKKRQRHNGTVGKKETMHEEEGDRQIAK